jgi:hypothetical protein
MSQFLLSCLVILSFPWVVFSTQYDLAIGAIFKNDALYLREWVEYHRRVGVSHFWLYDDESTDNWQEVLQPYIDQNLVEVFDWADCRQRIGKWPQIQLEAYKDVLVRASGVAEWLALVDTDEFIVPMKEKTIPECLKMHFSKDDAIYVSWRVFGTAGKVLEKEDSLLENLTFCSNIKHRWNTVGKTILRPEKVAIDRIWYVHHFPLIDSTRYRTGSARLLNMEDDDLFPLRHESKYLRINHYFFRDENFFRNVKIKRKLARNMTLEKLFSLYDACFKCTDTVILTK